MAPGGLCTAKADGTYRTYYDYAPCTEAEEILGENDVKSEKAALNREWFLQYFVHFQPIAIILSVVAKTLSPLAICGRRITRQHKTRQVKNL